MSRWDSCTFAPVESQNLHIGLTKCSLDWELGLLILMCPFLFEISHDWTNKAPLLILFHLLAGTLWISDSKHGWRGVPYVFFRVDVLGAEGNFSGEMSRCYLCSFGWVEYATKWEIPLGLMPLAKVQCCSGKACQPGRRSKSLTFTMHVINEARKVDLSWDT